MDGAREPTAPPPTTGSGKSGTATPGVIGHGLFPPEMVATVLVGRGETVDRTDFERVVS